MNSLGFRQNDNAGGSWKALETIAYVLRALNRKNALAEVSQIFENIIMQT